MTETRLLSLRDDGFVLHFGSQVHDVDTKTLAETLLAFTEAIQAASAIINPGFVTELRVEDIGPGSVRVKLKTVSRSLENLFSHELVKAVLVGLLTTMLYDAFLSKTAPPSITINTEEVVIEYGDQRLIVPRQVYEAKQKVDGAPEVREPLSRTIEAVEADDNIASFGIAAEMSDATPLIDIPRASFPDVRRNLLPPPDENRRSIDQTTIITVHKAVFEKSTRKWEFIWAGFRISAPIRDAAFFDNLMSRRIAIAQGDAFEADLRIHQVRDPAADAWINVGYEVLRIGRKTHHADAAPEFPI